MAEASVTCPRDGNPTRLTCASCGVPICPACLVRTPAGLKCPDCVGAIPAQRRRSRSLVVAGVAVALAIAAWLVVRPGASPEDGTPEVDPALRTSVIDIGEEAADGSFALTVTRFECGSRTFGVPPATRTATGRFCLAHLRVRNDGLRPDSFDGAAQFLVDSQARKHLPASALDGEAPTPPDAPPELRELTFVTLNPGGVAEGVLVFDLPESADPVEIELHGVPFFDFPGPGVRVRIG